MRPAAFCFAVLTAFAASAASQDRIREFFEWGEYDSLLIAIPAYCSGYAGPIDSARLCDYFGYLGVAFFAKGSLADARAAFRQALECSPVLALDSTYVTPEMLDLFADTRREVQKERERERRQDSLRMASERGRREREKAQKAEALRQRRFSELRSSFRKNLTYASVLSACCAAGAGAALYEYSAGREYEQEFRAAAASGDLRTYERYRDLLYRQNRNILGFSAVSVVSGCLASYFGFQSHALYRARSAITIGNGTYGILLAMDL